MASRSFVFSVLIVTRFRTPGTQFQADIVKV